MIYNIIDRRKRPYRWRYVYAIIEPTHHDNNIRGGDTDRIDPGLFAHNEADYDERVHIQLHDAIIWAERLPFAVTLFLYDDGTEKIEIGFDPSGRRTVRVRQELVMKP